MDSIKNGDVKSNEKPSLNFESLEIKDSVNNKTTVSSHEGSWRSCCFKNILPFSCYFGIFGLVTGALTTYLTSQVTTLEKQFGLSSSQSGILLSMNDAGYLVTVLLVAYFGRNAHIPRILAVCGFLYGVSAFICIIPHFFGGQDLSDQNFVSNSTQNVLLDDSRRLCAPETPEAPPSEDLKCSEEEKGFSSSRSIAIWLISLGMFIQGIAKSPRFTLSQTYIDDNVPKTEAGLHIGIIFALSVFGPAISFSVGGSVSQIHVTLEETEMTPRDPRWVGAWWLGFMAFGSVALLLSGPLLLFPKKLDNAPPRAVKSDCKSEGNKKISKKRILYLIKDVLRAFLRMARRPVWVFLVLGTSLRIFAISGISSFTPKYMQIHYGLSVFKANMIVGFANVGAAATAIFLSGILTRTLKLELRGMIRTIIITQIISSAFFLIGMFLECPQPEIRDFKIHSGLNSRETFSLPVEMNSSCFHGCYCDGEKFFPICGSDDVTYFSPCHAGCQTSTGKGYDDCLCVINGTRSLDESVLDAVPGTCQHECPLYIAFVVLAFFSSFIGGLGAVPVFLSILRSVEEQDKSLGFGVYSFVSSLTGWFLGPIVMGAVVDTTCRFWNTTCSEDGSCAVYDIADLRYKIHGVDLGISVLYIIFYICAYLCLTCCKAGKLYVNEKKEEEIKPPTKE